MTKGSTGAAAGGQRRIGILGALFYYWQQADAFWEYVWAVFPRRSSGLRTWCTRVPSARGVTRREAPVCGNSIPWTRRDERGRVAEPTRPRGGEQLFWSDDPGSSLAA